MTVSRDSWVEGINVGGALHFGVRWVSGSCSPKMFFVLTFTLLPASGSPGPTYHTYHVQQE